MRGEIKNIFRVDQAGKNRSELSTEGKKVERGAAQSKFEADRKLILLTIIDRAKYLLTHGVLLNWR